MSEKFVDKIKFFMGFGPYDDDEYPEEEIVEEKKPATNAFVAAAPPSKVVSLHNAVMTRGLSSTA